MGGELIEEIDDFKNRIEESFEEQGISDAMQKGSMDFEQPQNMLEWIQQLVNPSDHYNTKHPEISRDFGTSNLPQGVIWSIYGKSQNARFMKNLGLEPDEEYLSMLTILTLYKSREGWLVRETNTKRVGVERSNESRRSNWFRR